MSINTSIRIIRVSFRGGGGGIIPLARISSHLEVRLLGTAQSVRHPKKRLPNSTFAPSPDNFQNEGLILNLRIKQTFLTIYNIEQKGPFS